MKELQPVFIREEIIKSIREFFYQKKFHEVITPSLNSALPLEPNLYAFSTKWKTSSFNKTLYLSTSPESALKKMLAKGIGNCFAISKSFRNLEGAGTLHTPEFLMLEWYREEADYSVIMNDAKDLILFIKKRIDTYLQREKSSSLSFQNETISLYSDWPVLSLVELFKKYADLDYQEILKDEEMFKKAKTKGYTVENAEWGALFDQILVNEIEPSLPKSPFFLTDFPARISPLCTPQKEKPYLAERFELYLFGIELANGNTEFTDAKTVRTLFEQEKKYREEHDISTPLIDEVFLDALQMMSAKKYGGIGLGIDRLAMIMADVETITEIGIL